MRNRESIRETDFEVHDRHTARCDNRTRDTAAADMKREADIPRRRGARGETCDGSAESAFRGDEEDGEGAGMQEMRRGPWFEYDNMMEVELRCIVL